MISGVCLVTGGVCAAAMASTRSVQSIEDSNIALPVAAAASLPETVEAEAAAAGQPASQLGPDDYGIDATGNSAATCTGKMTSPVCLEAVEGPPEESLEGPSGGFGATASPFPICIINIRSHTHTHTHTHT